MGAVLVCCGHAPLMDFPGVPEAVESAVAADFARLAAWVGDFRPDRAIVFAPDHMTGFHYRLMPAFCIGARAEAIGDFRSPKGRLKVPDRLARDCAMAVREQGFDPALAYAMRVDHAVAQPLARLWGAIDRIEVLPIFRRVREFGAAVGRFVAGLEGRTLILGSGGLSHDATGPGIDSPDPEVRRALIEGLPETEEKNRRRIERALAIAKDYAAGRASSRPLNEAWDRNFLALLASGRIEAVDGYTDPWVAENGGRAAHEIRNWVAAFAALQAAEGEYRMALDCYRQVPEWLVALAMVRAWPNGEAR